MQLHVKHPFPQVYIDTRAMNYPSIGNWITNDLINCHTRCGSKELCTVEFNQELMILNNGSDSKLFWLRNFEQRLIHLWYLFCQQSIVESIFSQSEEAWWAYVVVVVVNPQTKLSQWKWNACLGTSITQSLSKTNTFHGDDVKKELILNI